jgi:branched-chain amino acid transport system substrate-binding protein
MKKSLLAALASAAFIVTGPVAYAEVLLGVAAPITGPNAAVGAQILRGAEQAVADLNAAGGINGEQVRIVVGDDVSDPKQGISVANKFVADGVGLVVGQYNSGVAIPVSEVLAENGILHITPAATNPVFTERGLWNTFRICGRDDQQGLIAGTYLAENFRDAKIALIHDKTPYGQGLADETKKALESAGISEAMYEGINPGDVDFSVLIAKMKEAGVSVIYYGGLHTEAGLILRQLADQGLDAQMMSGDGTASTEIAAIAGDAIEGFRFTFAPDPRRNPAATDAVEKFRASGFEPEAYTLYAYAAVQVIAKAAETAQSVDPTTVAESVKSNGPFDTVLGERAFDEKGDITNPDYIVYEWKRGEDGKFDYLPL